MTITINGSGTIAGITAGGLPDAVIQTADIVDLAVTPAKMSQKLTSGTSVASTSGTSIDFTGIPSWVKRITVLFSGVSTIGTSSYLIQIGSGSFVTSGYDCAWIYLGSAAGNGTSTVGFMLYSDSATDTSTGTVRLVHMGGNLWMPEASQFVTTRGASRYFKSTAGSITLGGVLDRVRITTVNGTDTFDAGSINIMYEG